ncbi:ethanolamine utilization protein [Pyrenochaeta sp. DS3sAY3a]|nr:ethanolamine utilization protein [Pyrenochaeta sp. DS3sAY3a]
MVFKALVESKFHHIPHLEGAPPEVFFDDVFTSSDPTVPNPLTGSLFLLEFSRDPKPAPHYDFDETGVVLKGELHLEDEAGNKAQLHPGDTFFINRGSTILFTTPRYAVAFKVASRTSHL